MKKILEVYDNDAKNPLLWKGGISKHVGDLIELMNNKNEFLLVNHQWETARNHKLLRKMSVSKKELVDCIEKVDAVHIHGYTSLLATQAMKEAIKQKKEIFWSPHFHPFNMLNRPLIGKIGFVLFISPKIKYLKKIFTINSEDTKFFGNYTKNVMRISHWNNNKRIEALEKKENMILFVGRNHENKGIKYLSILTKEGYEVHAVTSGKLSDNKIIQHENLSDIELEELYLKANLVVVPSRYEAWSLVSSESLTYGTPIVISDRVRIGDVLPKRNYISIYKYGDSNDFLTKVKETIGKKVNIDEMQSLFSSEKAYNLYRNCFLGIN